MKSRFILILAGLTLVLFSYSFAQVPQLINYQGKLTKTNGAPLDTTISMIFSIYADSNGTTLKWAETQGGVKVEKGIFSVLLGSVNPIPDTVFNGTLRYLGVKVGGDPEITPRKPMVSVPYAMRAASTWSGSIYRWNVFDTYDNGWNWLDGNGSSLFGGVTPSSWTDGNATAGMISADKEVQRTLFTRKGYGGKNALVYAEVFHQYSSTTGRVVVVLLRIRNTTGSAIIWQPYFKYTAYNAWGEMASVALNGVNQWTSVGGNGTQSANVSLSIPANRTSTVIFVSTSSQTYSISADIYLYLRQTFLAFYNNSLQLPPGLQYLDDLDIATGGWDQ
jgi:hypothetical protein